MVLNKLREQIKPAIDSLGRRINVSPTLLTTIGLLLSVVAGLLFATKPSQTYLAAAALVVSGFFDILDGSVARVHNRVTKVGSFNDSTLDRLAEIAIYAGIILGQEAPAGIVLLAMGLSLLVSYMRAKGESLGVVVFGVGVGERAERLIVLIVSSALGFVAIGLYIVIALSVITVVQRYYRILRSLDGRKTLV